VLYTKNGTYLYINSAYLSNEYTFDCIYLYNVNMKRSNEFHFVFT